MQKNTRERKEADEEKGERKETMRGGDGQEARRIQDKGERGRERAEESNLTYAGKGFNSWQFH